MRIQKFVVFSLLIGSSVRPAFSQTSQKQESGTSEQFFRARKVELAQAGSEDPLVEILRRKQAELDAIEAGKKAPATEPAKAPVAAKKDSEIHAHSPVSQPVAPKVGVPKVAVPTKNVAVPVATGADEDRLVEVLRKKQAELDAKEPAVAPAKPAVAATVKPIEKPVVNTNAAAIDREESEKRIRRIEAEIKAKEEAIKKTTKASPAVQKIEEKKSAVAAKSETKAKAAKTPAPIAPNLTTKEGRLAELLRKYKADEITPRDYHIERAKIVAEP